MVQIKKKDKRIHYSRLFDFSEVPEGSGFRLRRFWFQRITKVEGTLYVDNVRFSKYSFDETQISGLLNILV